MAQSALKSKEDLAQERADLEKRLKEIQKEESEYNGRRLKELKADIEKMLADEGFTMDDLMAGSKGSRKVAGGRAAAPAKYRHPENAEITWSGRGRQPGWYKDALENGKSADDLLI